MIDRIKWNWYDGTVKLYARLYLDAMGSSPVTDFTILFVIYFFFICYAIELYRIGFKRLLDIQSVYHLNFHFFKI